MHKKLSQKDNQLLLMEECLFKNQWFSCFHIQIQDLNVLLICRGFRLTFHDVFFCTNDGWRHRTRGVACNCPRLCSWVPLSFQMDSFTCLVLLFGSLSMMFAPSQSIMWFSVVAWSVMADLLKLDINLFPAPCVFIIVCVVYILPVCVRPIIESLFCLARYQWLDEYRI